MTIFPISTPAEYPWLLGFAGDKQKNCERLVLSKKLPNFDNQPRHCLNVVNRRQITTTSNGLLTPTEWVLPRGKKSVQKCKKRVISSDMFLFSKNPVTLFEFSVELLIWSEKKSKFTKQFIDTGHSLTIVWTKTILGNKVRPLHIFVAFYCWTLSWKWIILADNLA